jgi:hypothetical protein
VWALTTPGLAMVTFHVNHTLQYLPNSFYIFLPDIYNDGRKLDMLFAIAWNR